MIQVCEKIISDNNELKVLSSLDEIYEKLRLYLSNRFNIKEFDVVIENDVEEEIFDISVDTNTEYVYSLGFIQNSNTKVIFKLYANNEDDYNHITEKLFELELTLHTFSQTIYNKYLEQSINKMSLIDSVTGLHNRLYLDNYSDNILSIANREQKKIGFLKISIDQFKAVIDEFDYTIGDEVLKALAKSLTSTVRSSDIVLKIDGDEFLVILMNVINEDNAIMIAEKLINNFSNEKVLVNKETSQILKKTICVGVSVYPDDATTVEEIIKQSDIALYEAKNKGRSQAYKYTEEEANTIDFF